MRRLLGSGSLYTVATFAPMLSLLLVTPFVTRALGAHGYGQVAVAISVYQLGSVLLAFGLPVVVTRNAIIGKAGYSGAAGLVLAGTALAAASCIALAGTAVWWAPRLFPGVPWPVLTLGVVAGLGLAVVTLSQALLRAADLVVRFVAFGAAAALVPPALGLALIYLVSPNAETYVWGLAAGYLTVAVVAVAAVFRFEPVRVSLREVRGAVGVGAPTVPHALTVPLLLTAALSMVTQLTGVAAAGGLQVAALLGTAIITVMNAVNNAWSPLVFKATDATRPKLLADSTFVVALAMLALVCGYSLAGPTLVAMIGGPLVTIEHARASMLIAMAAVFHVMYLANIHLTFLSGRTWPLAILTPLSGLIALAALWLVAAFKPDLTLWVFAAIWPVFYAFQAVFSFVLARTGHYSPASFRWAAPPLALAAIVSAQATLFAWQPWGTIVSSGAAVATACVLGLLFKRRGGHAGVAPHN